MQRLKVIDSHTGGEPTRVVIDGGPDLGGGSLVERRERFAREFERYRSAIINEPRGSDVIVGALLVEPHDKSCSVGVIYFNNVGVIGMCGHGTIGLMITLSHMGRIRPGEHRIDTPVGVVTASLDAKGQVTVQNVPCWRAHKGVAVEVAGLGRVTGDVAWGGNWFFLVQEHGQLPHDQAMIVVQLAKTSNLLFGGTANFLVAREFSSLATYDQKLALMRCVFEVSATDEAISTAEESEIHRLANELRITPPDLIALRVAHRRHLPGVSREGPPSRE